MDEAVLTNHIVLDTIPLDTVPGPRSCDVMLVVTK